jgi:hypothetical protein
VARDAAPTLARGTYLVRLEPSAAELAPGVFRQDVETALRKAGRDRSRVSA